MKIKKLKYLLTVFVIAVFLNGCKDKEDIFIGTDSFINSFSLTQDGTTYNASFYADSIIISVPEGLSLNGASVTYSLSEQANIKPVPDDISNWNNEMLFAVTSYSGEEQTYKYIVKRNSIDAEGTVVLSTQDEVNDFGEQGVTSIKGSLIIGRIAGTDSITSLAALYQLKEVGYNITVNPTYAAKEFTGLDALETVGGEININDVKEIKSVEFQSLKSAGSIYIKNDSISSAEFPRLTQVAGDLRVDCPLNILNLTNLQNVGGQLSLLHSYNRGEITQIALPLLKSAGNIYIVRFKELTKIELPELVTSGDLSFLYMPSFNIVYLPKLIETTGTIKMTSTTDLAEVSLPALERAGGLDIPEFVKVLEVPLLSQVSGDLFLRGLTVENMDFLSSLTSVEGKFTIYNLPNLQTFKVPSALTNVGTLSIYYSRMLPPEEIDVKGLQMDELEIRGAALVDTKIIGDEEFDGVLNINSDGSLPTGATITFPELEGFSTIDSLILGYVKISNLNIKGIKKINKGFYLPSNSITEFYMPDLEEVGGDFLISHLNRSIQEIIEIPKLKTVGGDFNVTILSGETKTLAFPLLESVGGNFSLASGYQTRALTSVKFTSIKNITGKLSVTSGRSSYSNSIMTNLEGFSTLMNVSGVEITDQGALVSYEGLKNALSSFSADDWYVSNNAYNPTYEELNSGQWVQP